MNLKLEDEKLKEKLYNLLRDHGKVPSCKSCGKLFKFGFPNNHEGMVDFLICEENDLTCNCPNFKLIENLYKQKEDGLLDISPFYNV